MVTVAAALHISLPLLLLLVHAIIHSKTMRRTRILDNYKCNISALTGMEWNENKATNAQKFRAFRTNNNDSIHCCKNPDQI